jgi:alkylation response protein AidB-like acyl-CoA dehydrogenase
MVIPGVSTDRAQAELSARADAFCRNHLDPIAAEIDRTNQLPLDAVREMGKAGFLGIPIPEEFGGCGGSASDLLVVVEAIARSSGAVGNVLGVHTLCSYGAILGFGTAAQKQRYLPDLASGRLLGAFAITEADAGSDVANIGARAVRAGDGWRITGKKTQITSGTHADLLLVLANADLSLGHRGLTAFLVETRSPGFNVLAAQNSVGHRGSGLATLQFDNVFVHDDQMVGDVGGGLFLLKRVIEFDKLIAATSAMSIADAALMRTVEFAERRVQFGNPLSHLQAIQIALAEAAIDIHAIRALIRETVCAWDRGDEITLGAAAMKVLAAERALAICLSALHVHGGAGYVTELPLDRYIRDVQGFAIAAGATEIQKQIVARMLLPGHRQK